MYPINLLKGCSEALVIGAGEVGVRKINFLLSAGLKVKVISKEINFNFKEDESLEVIQKSFEISDINNVNLVFACTDNESLNLDIAKYCKENNILVLCASSAFDGSFINTAIFEDDNFIVSVSSKGKSPRKSIWLRDKLKDFIQKLEKEDLKKLER